VTVLGVTGWMCDRVGGDRVDVSPCWGWPGGCVLGVTGWMCTIQVVRSRGQCCGNIELVDYLVNAPETVPLVLDLRIAHG
jgi:hypothetical protein